MARQSFVYRQTKERKPEGRMAVGRFNHTIPARELVVSQLNGDYNLTPEGEYHLAVSPYTEQEFELDLIIPKRSVNKDSLERLVKDITIIEVEFPDNTEADNYIGSIRVNFFGGRGFPSLPGFLKEVVAKYEHEDVILYKN